jgi:hypothetical protein
VSFKPPMIIPPKRPTVVQKARDLARSLVGAGSRRIDPRKGQNPAGVQIRPDTSKTGAGRPLARTGVVDYGTIYNLADTDDIIFSLRRTVRSAIGELPWKAVPDLDGIKADLNRWRQCVEINMASPGLGLPFQPQTLTMSFFLRASGALQDLLKRVTAESKGDTSQIHTNPDLRQFFDNCLKHHQAIAESHLYAVRMALEQPNPSAESSFRAFLNLIVDDLMLFDAAAIVKNPTEDGQLGELYTLPGQNIRLYRSRDLSTPPPPHIAYDWFEEEKVRAVYNNLELVYLAANMRRNGYGKPPLEAILKLMVGALYGDNYLLEQFTNNNMPAGVFDLGEGIDDGERRAVEKSWDGKVAKGQRRIIFVANPAGVKGFIPIPQPSNKDQDINELFKLWAARKCAVFGMSLNDIGFTEDLHRTTAETQANLTQSRGVRSMADLIAGYINMEIVRGQLWLRDQPENPLCLDGVAYPVFPFRDVKFEFVQEEEEDKKEQADRDSALISNGVMCINEVREERGLRPIEGGDEHIISTGGTPMRVADLPILPTPTPEQMTQGLEAAGKQKGGDGTRAGNTPPIPGASAQDAAASAAKSIATLGESIVKAITGG